MPTVAKTKKRERLPVKLIPGWELARPKKRKLHHDDPKASNDVFPRVDSTLMPQGPTTYPGIQEFYATIKKLIVDRKLV